MCGIAGYLNSQNNNSNIIEAMTQKLESRGPDDHGAWLSEDGNIVLGHRRLSILDLSAGGHQPMVSISGRYVIVFNGEIYNFAILRIELEKLGYKFRGHSDTEVMLGAIDEWGIIEAVKKFNGMFAFALWDKKSRLLHLVRDRIGIKPLYYGWCGKTFLFGSELKALKVHPEFNADISRQSLSLFLQYNYVPVPYSIYSGIYKLLPGTILTIDEKKGDFLPEPSPYWSAKDIVQQDRLKLSEQEAVDGLEGLLLDSVKLRMVADVPLGCFLSGGVDSSLVAALMQSQSNKPIKTFSIGFFEDQYNEAQYAKKVAEHLNTDHTELYVSPGDAIEVIPKLPYLYDEPFADSSQIPTFLVSQLARQNVTVSLSGDGGDELFAGYNRYYWGDNIWRKIRLLPFGVRKSLAYILRKVPPGYWDKILFNKFHLAGDKMHKLAGILTLKTPDSLYQRLISLDQNSFDLVKNENLNNAAVDLYSKEGIEGSFVERMMYWDMMHYLPDDILTKVDRASMGVSLEARVPLLDHRVVEYAWQLPLPYKIHKDQSKWVLRQVLYKHVPSSLIDRPKMGFGVPIDSWLRSPLKDWAENLLNEQRLEQEEFLNPKPIRQKWNEHLSGKRNWQHQLWAVLMFQSWLDSLRD
jgi:asparagine synthase (glutamine-hydrolysing)